MWLIVFRVLSVLNDSFIVNFGRGWLVYYISVGCGVSSVCCCDLLE